MNFTRASFCVEVFRANKPKSQSTNVVKIPENYEFVVRFSIRKFEIILVKGLSCLGLTWVRESVVV